MRMSVGVSEALLPVCSDEPVNFLPCNSSCSPFAAVCYLELQKVETKKPFILAESTEWQGCSHYRS